MKIDKLTQQQIDLVANTLGPRGKLVIIDYRGNEAVCTKDGFSVAYKVQNPTHKKVKFNQKNQIRKGQNH